MGKKRTIKRKIDPNSKDQDLKNSDNSILDTEDLSFNTEESNLSNENSNQNDENDDYEDKEKFVVVDRSLKQQILIKFDSRKFDSNQKINIYDIIRSYYMDRNDDLAYKFLYEIYPKEYLKLKNTAMRPNYLIEAINPLLGFFNCDFIKEESFIFDYYLFIEAKYPEIIKFDDCPGCSHSIQIICNPVTEEVLQKIYKKLKEEEYEKDINQQAIEFLCLSMSGAQNNNNNNNFKILSSLFLRLVRDIRDFFFTLLLQSTNPKLIKNIFIKGNREHYGMIHEILVNPHSRENHNLSFERKIIKDLTHPCYNGKTAYIRNQIFLIASKCSQIELLGIHELLNFRITYIEFLNAIKGSNDLVVSHLLAKLWPKKIANQEMLDNLMTILLESNLKYHLKKTALVSIKYKILNSDGLLKADINKLNEIYSEDKISMTLLNSTIKRIFE